MKARIDNRPVVLHRGLSAQDVKALEGIAARRGLRLAAVRDRDMARPVGLLAGAGAGAAAPDETEIELHIPSMVLYRLEDSALDEFLADVRAAGISCPLKAVLTAANRGWSYAHLIGELERERAALEAMQGTKA